jgi:hypothetical protein
MRARRTARCYPQPEQPCHTAALVRSGKSGSALPTAVAPGCWSPADRKTRASLTSIGSVWHYSKSRTTATPDARSSAESLFLRLNTGAAGNDLRSRSRRISDCYSHPSRKPLSAGWPVDLAVGMEGHQMTRTDLRWSQVGARSQSTPAHLPRPRWESAVIRAGGVAAGVVAVAPAVVGDATARATEAAQLRRHGGARAGLGRQIRTGNSATARSWRGTSRCRSRPLASR